MNQPDADAMTSVSFIVRLWLEETAVDAGQAVWRGHVTHIPSGHRQHFSALEQLSEIIRQRLVDAAS